MTQVITVVDKEAPVMEGPADDIVVECEGDVPDFSDWAVTDNCDPNPTVETTMEYLEEADECGNYVMLVTCMAYDACGNQSEPMSFTITVNDETAPEFDNELPADVVLDCFDDVPAAEECTATDNCDPEPEVTYFEELIGDLPDEEAELDCVLNNPAAGCDVYDQAWSLIFTDGFLEDNEEYQYYTLVDGQWLSYEDGTAHITATVVSSTNPEAGFFIDVWFQDGVDYTTWDSMEFPTGYKSDCYDASDLENWMFYIMSAGATLEGWGDFAGSYLELAHAPSNYYYGYQLGVGANNQSEGYGSGGWFSYEGVFVDESEDLEVLVDGAGDLSFEHDCCPQYYIERTWCAIDCSGNETCFTQTISFEGDGIPTAPSVFVDNGGDVVVADKGDFQITSVRPNPAVEKTTISFVSNKDNDELVLEVYDMTGRSMGLLFRGEGEANVEYTLDYIVSNLESGLYNIRLRSGNEQVVEKLMISK